VSSFLTAFGVTPGESRAGKVGPLCIIAFLLTVAGVSRVAKKPALRLLVYSMMRLDRAVPLRCSVGETVSVLRNEARLLLQLGLTNGLRHVVLLVQWLVGIPRSSGLHPYLLHFLALL